MWIVNIEEGKFKCMDWIALPSAMGGGYEANGGDDLYVFGFMERDELVEKEMRKNLKLGTCKILPDI